MMAFIGERRSWDMRRRNWDLLRLACSIWAFCATLRKTGSTILETEPGAPREAVQAALRYKRVSVTDVYVATMQRSCVRTLKSLPPR